MSGMDGFLERHPVWTVVLTLTGLLSGLIVIGGCAGGGSTTASSSSTSVVSSSRRAESTVATTSPAASKTTTAAKRSETAGSAVAALAKLPVKGRAPMTGYSRERFGDGWLTVDGCDTRDRILRRDLSRKAFAAGDTCRVRSGRLNDPYTAAATTFVRGGASEVDIDHVVALGDAWQTGAQRWSAARRVAFANDPLELLSVDAVANRQKGDGDAATWLPANKAFRCSYVARQIAVKRKYHAWVTPAEHDAMVRVLRACPGLKLPTSGHAPSPIVASHGAPPNQPKPISRPEAAPTPAGHGRVFANCAAVRAAGLAPLRRGTADYAANPKLDRDHDGLACE